MLGFAVFGRCLRGANLWPWWADSRPPARSKAPMLIRQRYEGKFTYVQGIGIEWRTMRLRIEGVYIYHAILRVCISNLP